ncbi:MAG: MFS transporter [Verrucomicrobia bacterium]|nr:MFS transporter [Verrucomicrobiota bacterium]
MNTVSPPGSAEKTYTCGSLIYSRRGLIAMFAWMLWGDFCFTLMEAVVPSIIPLKFHSLNTSDTTISLLMTSLPAIFNFTVTPSISIWSDRLRTRWGRRMPFIIGTLPFLALSLVMIGLNSEIASWIHRHFFSESGYDQAKVAIIVLACCLGLFDLFNMFINTVYWYLFNDIVPQEMLGRFMSQFRIVGTLASMLYNFFIFQFAESHMREIYLGAALLYFVGFGVVCLRVREGTYPPPEENTKGLGFFAGLMAVLKSFGRECFTSRYYWYFMLEPVVVSLAAFAPFGVFLNKSMGLTLGNIGFIGGISSGTMIIGLYFGGKLVDRWHPIRASAYLSAFSAFTGFGGWVWLFVNKPNPTLYLWIAALHGALFMPLFQGVFQVGGMTRFMRLVPKDKLGQFSAAMCLMRAAVIFASGFLSGAFLDMVKHLHPATPDDPEGLFRYRYMFLYTGVTTLVAFVFQYKVFRGWKRLGGEVSYVAPSADVDVYKLPPRAGDTGRVPKGLVLVALSAGIGGLLGNLAWIGYYSWWERNMHYVTVFSIAAISTAAILVFYVRFVKFMERP